MKETRGTIKDFKKNNEKAGESIPRTPREDGGDGEGDCPAIFLAKRAKLFFFFFLFLIGTHPTDRSIVRRSPTHKLRIFC